MMEADDEDEDDDYQEVDSSMAQAVDDDYLLRVDDVFSTGVLKFIPCLQHSTSFLLHYLLLVLLFNCIIIIIIIG